MRVSFGKNFSQHSKYEIKVAEAVRKQSKFILTIERFDNVEIDKASFLQHRHT